MATILDYLKAQYGIPVNSFGMAQPDPSLYADQAQTAPDPTGGMSAPGMSVPQAQPPNAAAPIPMSPALSGSPMSPVQGPADAPPSIWDRIKAGMQDPGTARMLLSAGAALMQAGGPSERPVGTGQALGAAINQGGSAFDQYRRSQLEQAAQKQAMGANQWTTLTPAQVKAKGLQDPGPGYQLQMNGNGEIKSVGQEVIKSGTDANGMPALIDTRNLGSQTAAASSWGPGTIPGPYDPQTLDMAATDVLTNPGNIYHYGSGKYGQASIKQVQKAVAQKLSAAGMTAAQMVQLRKQAQAEGSNVQTLTKQQAQINAADTLVHANGDRLLQLFDMVDDTGVPMIEGIARSVKAKAGNVNAAELQSVLTTFQTEVAKMLGGNPNMTGVISDNMRQEIMKMAPGSMSTAQAKRIINRLYLETSIRQQAVNDQLNKGLQQSVVGGQPAQPSVAPGTAAAPSIPAGWTVVQH